MDNQQLIAEKVFELQERNPSDEGSLEDRETGRTRDKDCTSESEMGGHGEPFRRSGGCCHCLYRFLCCRCCRGEEMNVERKVWFDGRSEPVNGISNAVNNQKYNVLNFLPLVLFNQFKLFFNFFQLAINLSQLVPILKVGTPRPTQAFSSPTSRRSSSS